MAGSDVIFKGVTPVIGNSIRTCLYTNCRKVSPLSASRAPSGNLPVKLAEPSGPALFLASLSSHNSHLIYSLLMIRLLLILVVLTSAAHADDLKGKPRIVDGDTIWIGPTKIRLHGVDAPESKQTCQKADSSKYRCGEMATFALAETIEAH